ncbi:MAG: multidrug effflux MFS transporter [Hyphomicrobiales bacterium]|nr:multidrug effflux MFS transporter [Hyphomicrobiales bacterium]
MALPAHRLGFTLFLGAVSILPPLAIDTSLPSLPAIQAEFRASAVEASAVIAIFLLGFSTAPLAVGPLADRYGRKPVMVAGVLLFTLCAAGCALAPSIGALLGFRLLQGVGAGAVGILPRAIIRDLFEGREARLQLAAVSIVFSVAPLIAPTLGAAILAFGDWRTIFAALVVVGVLVALAALLVFKESHPPANRRSLMPAAIVEGYRRAVVNRMCAGFSVVGGLGFAGLFAYVNTSPLLFMEGFGVSKAGFAGLFAVTASGVIFGSTINAWLINRHVRPRRVLDVALLLLALAGLALLALGLMGGATPLLVAAPVMVYISTFGLVFPNAVHEAIHPLPEIAGVASAVVQTVQMVCGALGGVIAAAIYHDASPLSIGLVMSAGSLASAALYAFWLRPGVGD